MTMQDKNIIENDVNEEAEAAEEQEEEKLSPDELREKNLAVFKNANMEIYNQIANYKPKSELVFLENGEPDVLFNGIYLYQEKGAHTYCKGQLEQFKKAPNRFSIGRILGKNLDPDCHRFGYDVEEKIKEEELAVEGIQSLRSFYLNVFGIGLGTFLEELIEETQTQHLNLYEVNFELFYHSLSVTDWEPIFKKFPCTPGMPSLSFMFTTETDQISTWLSRRIRSINPGASDGLLVFGHYKSSIFEAALKRLVSGEYETGMMGLGYYEDEYYMISNAYQNLSNGNARILKKILEPSNIPVLICGNGPSLDTLMPFIKENQKRAIIVSCGSTLDALLNNDVMPDFHVMIERSSGLIRDQKISAEKWDISKICFVGSTNIYPEVANFHDEKILFFRPGISPTPLFMIKSDQTPANGDPLVANAALAFITSAGFKEIYFCGVDAGAKDPAQHHSKDSQYHTRGVKYRHDFNKVAPANFGGTVHTTSALIWSKKALEQLIKTNFRRHKYFNLSDGALIEGATPKHVSRIKFPAIRSKKKEVKEIIKKFPQYTKEMFGLAWKKGDIENRLTLMKDQLIEVIAENDLTEFDYLSKFTPILKPGIASDAVAMIYRGTVHGMIMQIFTTMERISSEEDKRKYETIIKEIFPVHMNYMCDEFLKRIQDLKDDSVDWTLGKDLDWQREWQEEFVEKAGIVFESRDR